MPEAGAGSVILVRSNRVVFSHLGAQPGGTVAAPAARFQRGDPHAATGRRVGPAVRQSPGRIECAQPSGAALIFPGAATRSLDLVPADVRGLPGYARSAVAVVRSVARAARHSALRSQ